MLCRCFYQSMEEGITKSSCEAAILCDEPRLNSLPNVEIRLVSIMFYTPYLQKGNTITMLDKKEGG